MKQNRLKVLNNFAPITAIIKFWDLTRWIMWWMRSANLRRHGLFCRCSSRAYREFHAHQFLKNKYGSVDRGYVIEVQ